MSPAGGAFIAFRDRVNPTARVGCVFGYRGAPDGGERLKTQEIGGSQFVIVDRTG